MIKMAVIDIVECGEDVDNTEPGVLLSDDDIGQFIVQRDKIEFL